MGYGTIINVFGSVADLDQVSDGATYRKVVGVNEYGQITMASIAPEVPVGGSVSLTDGCVQSNHIASGAVQGWHISDGQIQSNHIASGAVNGMHIADGSIQSNHIASMAVLGWHIADGAVCSNHIASGAIMGWHIPDGTITTNHLGASQVTSDKTSGYSGNFTVDGNMFTVTNGLITAAGA